MKNIINFIQLEKKHFPYWWKEISIFRKVAPLFLILLYLITLFLLKGLRIDHFLASSLILFLSYSGRFGNKVLTFILPIFLTGVVYESQHYYSDLIRGAIHVKFPYEFDKKYFGINVETIVDSKIVIERLTPNEFLGRHIHPILDLITGFFYLFFIAIYVGICFYHVFILKKHPNHPLKRLVTWGFFFLNVLGYTTYYWFPAAPPWYVSLHGLGEPPLMNTPPNVAGCGRFDALLGTHFFSEMYGRSADVFGAIPSLHVAYPFLSFLFSLQFKSLRIFSFCFFITMFFSAVYLNHHYVIDVLWGLSYTLFVFGCLFWYSKRQKEQ